MSGMGMPKDLRDPAQFAAAEATINVNLVGTIRVIDAFTPHLLEQEAYGAEVMDLLTQNPKPHEILVQTALMHRWAERDGTYDELVAQRSQALAMLPGRAQG
jgi:short-subunit dehydrogenase involved in D-alanine esterification of teichoic acids